MNTKTLKPRPDIYHSSETLDTPQNKVRIINEQQQSTLQHQELVIRLRKALELFVACSRGA